MKKRRLHHDSRAVSLLSAAKLICFTVHEAVQGRSTPGAPALLPNHFYFSDME